MINSATQTCSQCRFENPRSFRSCARCGHCLLQAGRPSLSSSETTASSDAWDDETLVNPLSSTEAARLSIEAEDREPPLVGQTEAATAIRTAVETSFGRSLATLLALEGNSGAGRTRMLFYAAECAARFATDARVLYGLCRAEDGPHAPFSRMLLERFGATPATSPDSVRAQVVSIVGEALGETDSVQITETSHLLGHLAGIPFLDSPFLESLRERPEELASRARAAFGRFFEGDARIRPLLVLIDNVHHADDEAWELISVLAKSSAPIAVAVAGDPPIGDRAERIEAAGGTATGPIDRLDEAEVAAMLESLLPELTGDVEPLIAALAHRSRGNPTALRELTLALLEAGLFVRTERGLEVDLRELESGALPITITDAIHARLARLDELERATLDRAAVVGEVFSDRAILAQMRSERRPRGDRNEPMTLWPDDEDQVALEGALRRLETKGFLTTIEGHDVGAGREFRFVLSELHLLLYSAQPPEMLEQRHATVAHWITVSFERHQDGVPAMVAPHLERAGMSDRAGRAYLDAAKEELAKMHTQSALRHIEKALELVPPYEIDRRIDALHVLGSLLTTLGRYDEALAAFSEMLEASWRVGARGKGGAALNRIARIRRMRGEEESARELLLRALALFRAAADQRGVASTLDDLAQVERLLGNLDEAIRAANEALEIRRMYGDSRGEAVSLNTLGMIEHGLGHLESAEQRFRSALDIREAIGDRAGVMESFHTLGLVAGERGDLERAETAWRAALQEARKMADRRMQAVVLNNLGDVLLRLERMDEARGLLLEARALAHAIGDRRAMADVERNLGWVELRTKDGDPRATLERALTMAEEYGNKEAIAHAHRAFGVFFADGARKGEPSDGTAEESFLLAIDLYRDVGDEKDAARALFDLGRHLLARGEKDNARERLEEARAIMRQIGLAELEHVERALLELE